MKRLFLVAALAICALPAFGQAAWVISTAYSINDAVSNDGGTYICTQAHTSSATDEPGTGASWPNFWNRARPSYDLRRYTNFSTNTDDVMVRAIDMDDSLFVNVSVDSLWYSVVNSSTSAKVPNAKLSVGAFTYMSNIVVIAPASYTNGFIQAKLPTASTVTRVTCSTNTGTATIQLDERVETTPNSAGTDIMSSTLVCDTNQQATTTFSNAGIAADALISLDIDATASTPGVARIHIEYTAND